MIFTVIDNFDIDTGYQNWHNWLPAGYYVYNRVASRAFPRVPSPLCFMTGTQIRHYNVYDRLAISALSAVELACGTLGRDALADVGQDISGCAILQQGMSLKVFSEVYCDRVYFLCAGAVCDRVRF